MYSLSEPVDCCWRSCCPVCWGISIVVSPTKLRERIVCAPHQLTPNRCALVVRSVLGMFGRRQRGVFLSIRFQGRSHVQVLNNPPAPDHAALDSRVVTMDGDGSPPFGFPARPTRNPSAPKRLIQPIL